MHVVLTVWAWACAHPEWVIPLVTGACSLVYGRLDKYPRMHAVFAALAGAGLDLPRIIAMVQKAITGKPGAGGKAGGGTGVDTTPPNTVFVSVPVNTTPEVPDAAK